MKTSFIIFCVLVSAGFATASVQTTANQDKPPRLYVKSYIESSSGFTTSSTTYVSPWGNETYEDIFTPSDSVNWADGSAGSFSWNYYHTFNTPWASYNEAHGLTLSWPPTSWENIPYVIPTSLETYSSSQFPYLDSTNCGSEGYAPIIFEYCDITGPMFNNSGTFGSFNDWSSFANVSATASRTAVTVMKLQTGGKAISRLRNMLGISATAMRYDPINSPMLGFWESSVEAPYEIDEIRNNGSSTTVPPQSINLGTYGSLNANGVKYLVLPDNADVDVTPYVPGVDYYTYALGSPQKYHSYFDLYVQQANPGYSLNPYGTTNDIGHAFWGFRTDAPSDALQYISTNLTSLLDDGLGEGPLWGFYPVNGIDNVPGVLLDDGNLDGRTHSYNIKRSFYIGFPDLLQGLIYTRGIKNAPPRYYLLYVNCVTVAVHAGNAANVYGLPFNPDPQNFGIELLQMYPAPGYVIGPFDDETDVFYSWLSY